MKTPHSKKDSRGKFLSRVEPGKPFVYERDCYFQQTNGRRRNLPWEKKIEMAMLYMFSDLTIDQIAALYGVERTTPRQVFRYWNVKFRRRPNAS